MGQKVQGSSFSSTARDALELAALQGLVAASSGAGQAPEFAVLQQQALTLRSLLLQRNKPEPEKLRSLLRCSNKQASSRAGDPLELVAFQQQASSGASGACCVPATSKLWCHRLLLLLLFLQHKEEVTQREMLTWVLRGSSYSRSKLVPNSKLAPTPSRFQAPSSLPLNVSGARSSGDGVRGRGW